MKISDLRLGECCYITDITCQEYLKARLEEYGFIKNAEIKIMHISPCNDLITCCVDGNYISIPISEAKNIIVTPLHQKPIAEEDVIFPCHGCLRPCHRFQNTQENVTTEFSVAFLGNANCGKTTLFNILTSRHERVGNYAGVTVDVKDGYICYKNNRINIIDLPGINSLDANNEEEVKCVQRILHTQKPDVIINIIDSTNLKKNLFLTTQLLDLNMKTLCVLNFFDNFKKYGYSIDIQQLSKNLNIDIIPLMSLTKDNIEQMLDAIISIHNTNDDASDKLKTLSRSGKKISLSRSCKEISLSRSGEKISPQNPTERYSYIENLLNDAAFVCDNNRKYILTDIIDSYLLGKYSWLLFFIIAIYVMFTMTFTFGGILSNNLENIINVIKDYLYILLPMSTFSDIILNGIIPGLSNIIIFVPQVFILYFFIFFFENSGYITRMEFLINNIMHRIGLTGEAFIPFITGFGCNAQGILTTKNIKSTKNKIITCLLIPMLSCPAKLPIYIFCTSLFFAPFIQTTIIIGIYFCGIFVAIISSKILNWCLNSNTPQQTFIIEHSIYTMPEFGTILHNAWHQVKDFIKKISIIVFFTSLLIWCLQYYPNHEVDDNISQESYISQIGRKMEPLLKYNGFNWKLDIALLCGIVTKESIGSILKILYPGDSDNVKATMIQEGINSFTIIAFLLFILFYFPCTATLIAIKAILGIKWAMVSFLLNTTIAYMISLLVYNLQFMF